MKKALNLLIFDEVTDKTKLAPFFMAHGVEVTWNILWRPVAGIFAQDHRTRLRLYWYNGQYIINLLNLQARLLLAGNDTVPI